MTRKKNHNSPEETIFGLLVMEINMTIMFVYFLLFTIMNKNENKWELGNSFDIKMGWQYSLRCLKCVQDVF